MNDYRTRDHGNTLTLGPRRADQGRGLPHGSLYLALRGDALTHEGEREPVALFGFRKHSNSAHPDHDAVTRADIAETPAVSPGSSENDEGIHALVFDGDPLAGAPDQGPVVGGGVKLFRGAAVRGGFAPFHVSRLDRRTA